MFEEEVLPIFLQRYKPADRSYWHIYMLCTELFQKGLFVDPHQMYECIKKGREYVLEKPQIQKKN